MRKKQAEFDPKKDEDKDSLPPAIAALFDQSTDHDALSDGDEARQNKQLIEAAKSGDIEAIRELLKAGVDIEAMSNDGGTALIWAAEQGHTEAMRELLKAGSDIEASKMPSPSSYLQALLKAGADIEAKDNLWDNLGMTALIVTASKGKTEAVKELLKAGANIEARARNGRTALIVAASKGKAEVVRALLKAGANIEARGNNGWTAFDWWQSKQRNHPDFQEITELLRVWMSAYAYVLQGGVNARGEGGYTPLIWATEDGNIEAIRELVKAGADINARTNNDFTALMVAAFEGQTEAIRELLKAGADIEARNNDDGNTALILAAREGKPEVIRELLKAGADIEARDILGRTALIKAASWMDAIRWKRTEAIKELLKAGADVKARDIDGKTAFDLWQEFQKDHPEYKYEKISRLLHPDGNRLPSLLPF